MDFLVRKLNKLRFNSFLLQFMENFMDQNTGVAFFPGAALFLPIPSERYADCRPIIR